MAKKRRLYKSWIGIPIWIITGLAIFILFSAVYDWIVLDRSYVRYALMIASGVILVITVILHFVSLRFISNQARKQMGG